MIHDDKRESSLEDFLQPLEKSFQEAKSRFGTGMEKIVPPKVGEVHKSDDKILISLSVDATKWIYVMNPGATPYEVLFTLTERGGWRAHTNQNNQSRIIEDLVKNVLCPTVMQIKQENPFSQIVFVYYIEDVYTGYPPHVRDIPATIQMEITRQMINIPRKTMIFPNLEYSDRDTEIIQSAHGYEKR
ncbi:MAG: hypothetical protein V2A62_01430 [Candidatus Woesearchaeota archaeon]